MTMKKGRGKKKRKDDVKSFSPFDNGSSYILEFIYLNILTVCRSQRFNTRLLYFVAYIRDIYNVNTRTIMASWLNKIFIYLSLFIVKYKKPNE